MRDRLCGLKTLHRITRGGEPALVGTAACEWGGGGDNSIGGNIRIIVVLGGKNGPQNTYCVHGISVGTGSFITPQTNVHTPQPKWLLIHPPTGTHFPPQKVVQNGHSHVHLCALVLDWGRGGAQGWA